jgi:cytochrome b6-f complex iron-sulfur subunit
MARRTPEEILAQREAWMARKAAREAGEDVPIQPPLKPGEVAEEQAQPEVSEAAAEPEESPATEEAPQPKEAEPAQAEPQPVVAEPQPGAGQPAAGAPQKPAQRRTPEEILAQREAWMARKAARASGQTPPPAPTPEPAPAAPAAAAPAPKAAAKSAPKPKPKAAAKPAPRKKAAPAPEPIDPVVTRREFLNYAWLASIGLFAVQSVGISLWFAFPNFKEGEFGGAFPLGPAQNVLPEVNAPPVPYTDGKFWLTNVDMDSPDGEPRKGILALFKVCTHLGCLYDWADVTTRFECPCHGSKFSLTGDYIGGPARRSLDRFVIQALNADGTIRVQTNENGEPLEVLPEDVLVIDTGQRILGSSDIVPA